MLCIYFLNWLLTIKFLEAFQNEKFIINNSFTYDGVDYLRNSDYVDYLNARYLLINLLQGFPHKCESRTKFIVPLFFKFLKYVFRKKNS